MSSVTKLIDAAAHIYFLGQALNIDAARRESAAASVALRAATQRLRLEAQARAELISRAERGRCIRWADEGDVFAKRDPLLRWAIDARNADAHVSLRPTTQVRGLIKELTEFDEPELGETLQLRADGYWWARALGTPWEIRRPASSNREGGVSFHAVDAPTEHLGRPLTTDNPAQMLGLALDFYRYRWVEALQRWPESASAVGPSA